MDWSRKSSPHCHASSRSLSSLEMPALHLRGKLSTSSRWDVILGSDMYFKAAYANLQRMCASRDSSLIAKQEHYCGPNDLMEVSKMCSISKTRLRQALQEQLRRGSTKRKQREPDKSHSEISRPTIYFSVECPISMSIAKKGG